MLEVEFRNIEGYDDIKNIVRRALDAEDNFNLLFIGPPASAKTLFDELYEKRESLNTQVEKLEIQSQINALYEKIENLCIINDN